MPHVRVILWLFFLALQHLLFISVSPTTLQRTNAINSAVEESLDTMSEPINTHRNLCPCAHSRFFYLLGSTGAPRARGGPAVPVPLRAYLFGRLASIRMAPVLPSRTSAMRFHDSHAQFAQMEASSRPARLQLKR